MEGNVSAADVALELLTHGKYESYRSAAASVTGVVVCSSRCPRFQL